VRHLSIYVVVLIVLPLIEDTTNKLRDTSVT